MAENFSRIEDYITNKLSATEKKEFEAELNNNQVLAERYNFYKNIQKQQFIELKPIEFEKKILPEINDINFTEKKKKPGQANKTIIGIVIIFIALSSYLYMSNNTSKTEIAILNLKKDSIEAAYQKVLNDTLIESNIVVNLEVQENEIAILKKDSEATAPLKKEIETLKKELAKVKQEYYENAGNFADDTQQNKFLGQNLLLNLSLFTRGDYLVFRWKNGESYKISILNPDKTMLGESVDYITARWQIKKPDIGFYLVKFHPKGKRNINFLLESKGNLNPKIWLPNK